ncbi:hypothetical protein FACS1894208_11920 [Clostridia bacterium]|nr:hypothetical protein FACS1894208_11920 [Clostridia bacterium]
MSWKAAIQCSAIHDIELPKFRAQLEREGKKLLDKSPLALWLYVLDEGYKNPKFMEGVRQPILRENLLSLRQNTGSLAERGGTSAPDKIAAALIAAASLWGIVISFARADALGGAWFIFLLINLLVGVLGAANALFPNAMWEWKLGNPRGASHN